MSSAASPLSAFHLIGDRSGLDPVEAGLRGLRPALFGNYQALDQLRYDFPVVLITEPDDGIWAKSLSDIVDDILRQIAEPGQEGEETRRQVLSLEQIIRSLVASGQKGSLSLFWEAARRRLPGADSGTTTDNVNTKLQQAGSLLGFDGEIMDCDHSLAEALVSCAWKVSEAHKSEKLRRRVERLAQKLSDILQVDEMNSPGSREASLLESAMGSGNQTVFDFQAMARVLRTAPLAEPMPAQKRSRIQAAIRVFTEQRFVALTGKSATEKETYRFAYHDCATALAKFRERLPMMASLVKAISVAQLEIENRYDETRHDEFFNGFDESRLGPGDMELFPSYLLCLNSTEETDQAAILEVLRLGLPFKIVAQTDDILFDDVIGNGRLSFGSRSQQLARMATGLENVFVLQAASSSLYCLKNSIMHGLASDRAALFSVYSGSAQGAYRAEGHSSTANPDIPNYLLAAAATESRLFPCFVYDPAAGSGQTARYHLEGNPQANRDWPSHPFRYEDASHGNRSDVLAFTFLDFVATDPRYAERFACVPQEDWNAEMIPASDYLELNAGQKTSKVPYLQLIDQDNILHRAVFDDRLIDAARRCRDTWHSLQELGGINNSHVAVALEEAQRLWDQEKEELNSQVSSPAAITTVTAAEVPDSAAVTQAAAPAVAAVVEEPEPSSDDPWIETIRCTTCNECTELNDRMFNYNEDMRAYVADPDAGTYRELVEAAETCQVAIIHPGKPRNPDEAGLEELMVRAELFM